MSQQAHPGDVGGSDNDSDIEVLDGKPLGWNEDAASAINIGPSITVTEADNFTEDQQSIFSDGIGYTTDVPSSSSAGFSSEDDQDSRWPATDKDDIVSFNDNETRMPPKRKRTPEVDTDDEPDTDDERRKKHRGAGASSKRGKKKTSKQRRDTLEKDEWIKDAHPHYVTCQGCNKEVALDKKRTYAASNWERHRVACSHITGITKKRVFNAGIKTFAEVGWFACLTYNGELKLFDSAHLEHHHSRCSSQKQGLHSRRHLQARNTCLSLLCHHSANRRSLQKQHTLPKHTQR
jgi:hypothetical protein